MTACGTDYLTKDWSSKSYILVYSVFVYYIPLFTIIYSYYFIVSVSVCVLQKDVKTNIAFDDLKKTWSFKTAFLKTGSSCS